MTNLKQTAFNRLGFTLILTIHHMCLAGSIIDRPSIVFRNMGVDQGLSNSQIYSVHQDPTGLIWIGTGEGLNSYDGVSFKTYNKENSNLGNDVVRAIKSTDDNALWIATDDGLYTWPPNSKELIRFHLPSKKRQGRPIHDLLVDHHGNVWVAHGAGISIILTNTQEILTTLDGIHARTLARDDLGHTWVGTNTGHI